VTVRALLVAPLLALVVVAGGCGQSATDKATADLSKSFDRLGFEENYGAILKDVQGRPQFLGRDLRRFDLSARALADDIGKDRVRTMLAQDANEIADLCQRCAEAFDRTRATL
jgi:hypothetical protein